MKMNLKDETDDKYWSSELNTFKKSARILIMGTESRKFSSFLTEKSNVRAVRSISN